MFSFMVYVIAIVVFLFLLLMSLVIAIPLASILTTTRAMITGRYLNRYYVVSHKGGGVYELHCSPAIGYFYAKREKFEAVREDALCKFRRRYPHCKLYSVSSTLQDFYGRQGIAGTPMAETRFKRFLGNALNVLLILRNIANYRKRNKNEWQIPYLIRRVRRTIPQRYDLL